MNLLAYQMEDMRNRFIQPRNQKLAANPGDEIVTEQ